MARRDLVKSKPANVRETSMFGMTNDTSGTNALELLKHDHREVDKLFSQYEDIKDGAEDPAKEELVSQICDALTVHAQIEETIFYPAARRALSQEDGQDLLNEAAVEHQTLKDIIARLERKQQLEGRMSRSSQGNGSRGRKASGSEASQSSQRSSREQGQRESDQGSRNTH
jgi:hemerythrin-like domain-containing protein